MATQDVKIKITAADQTRTAFSSASAGLERMRTSALGVNSALAAIGVGVSIGGLATFAKSGIDAADSLNDLSQRVGVSVKDLASFKLAAEQSGTSLDDVGAGIARLSRSIGEAERGNKKAAAALSELGVTARDPKEAFLQLADAVKRIEDPNRRATLLNDVLGKSYQELIPLLNQGSEALRKSAQDSESFADAMARLAPEADKFNDSMAELKQEAAGAGAALLQRLVPGMADTAKSVRELLDDDKGMQALVRAFAGLGKLPFDAIFGDIKPADNAAERIAELNKEITQLKRNLTSAGPNSRGGLLGSSDDIRQQITVRENQVAALKKFGDQIYKKKQEDQKKDVAETVNYGAQLQDALRKGLSTAPFDDFLKTFKDRRKAIAAEYQALKLELSGASGGVVTSLDISREITLGRGALAGGDLEAAQAAAKRAKELFKKMASDEGTAGFEKSYFLRELERLETDALGAAESTAVKLKQTIEQQLAQLNTDATKLEVAVDETGIVNQVKKAIDDARKALQDNPLVIPIVGVPSISSDGRQGVDISTAARQYGGRR